MERYTLKLKTSPSSNEDLELRNLLIEVASSYDRHHPLQHEQPAQLRLKDSKITLRKFAPLGFKIDGSGKKPQHLPFTPWIGFLNLDESRTFQEGIYVVYLFSEDLTRVYLSLNQGTEKLKQKYNLTTSKQHHFLRTHAEIYQNKFSDTESDGLVKQINLGNHKGRPGTYEAGNIFAIEYETASLPSPGVINSDLQRFFFLYDKVLQHRNDLVLQKKIELTGLETNYDKIEGAGLGGFKPKDDSDYVALMPAHTLTKSRRHESLVRNFGEWAINSEFSASTPHPIDLVLRQESNTWIVEAKIVYNLNYAHAVRGAIGQLLEYRHFLRPNARLIALFDVEVGDGYLKLLKTLDIAAVWPVSNGWKSANADDHLTSLPFIPIDS